MKKNVSNEKSSQGLTKDWLANYHAYQAPEVRGNLVPIWEKSSAVQVNQQNDLNKVTEKNKKIIFQEIFNIRFK